MSKSILLSTKLALDKFKRYFSSPKKAFETLFLLYQRKYVNKSWLFDREFYLNEYPEVKESGIDPVLHYLLCGAKNGYQPSRFFIPEEYLYIHQDAKKSRLNPLVHYVKEHRKNPPFVNYSLVHDLCVGRLNISHEYVHEEWFKFTEEAIRKKTSKGERIKILFFVTTPSIFPARNLFEQALCHSLYSATIVVIPDTRQADIDGYMNNCKEELSRIYPNEQIIVASRDENNDWIDIIEEQSADIVCYPMPYNISSFRYNSQYAIGREFLPIYVNYGYPCTKFALPVLAKSHYANCWKVFLESDDALEYYKNASPISGSNGVVVGNIKMDSLAKYEKTLSSRKRIIIAPHHSVEGGLNDALMLSNFLKYSSSFLSIPEKYPQIDFVFRPHPFLFHTLMRDCFWGKEKVNEYIEKLKSFPNVTWSTGGDYIREFALSDGIIQDCASFLIDYAFTKKPCCYMLRSSNDIEEKFLSSGKKCLSASYIAYEQKDIENFIENVILGENDEKKEIRYSVCEELMVNFPNAATKALDIITTSLCNQKDK